MLWTVAHQVPLSMGCSRPEYWNGLPFPSQGDLPNPGMEPASLMSPALTGRFSTTSATWETNRTQQKSYFCDEITKGSGFQLAHSPWFALFYFDGSFLPCCELPYGKAHMVKKKNTKRGLWTAGSEEQNPANYYWVSLEADPPSESCSDSLSQHLSGSLWKTPGQGLS